MSLRLHWIGICLVFIPFSLFCLMEPKPFPFPPFVLCELFGC